MFVLSVKGSIRRCQPRSLELTWPGLVDQEVATAAWVDQLEQTATTFDDESDLRNGSTYAWGEADPAQLQAARTILAIQRQFMHASLEMSKAASRLGVDRLHQKFCNPDEHEAALLSYEEAADYLISQAPPNDPARSFSPMEKALLSYAVYDYMMGQPVHYMAGTEARSAATFTVQPQADVRDLQTAAKWMSSEHPDSPVNQFIEKARSILRFSQQFPPSLQAPSCAKFEDTSKLPDFTESDKLIIRLLQRALVTERLTQLPIYADILSNIIQHLALPQPGTSLVDLNIAVLKRLGVLTPWENLVKSDPALMPWYDRLPKMSSNHIHRLLPRPDAHAVDNIRRDFGNLPVYIIDSEDASELDDGLSVEPAAEVDGQKSWWVHAHIADPTHALNPTDSRAFIASRRKETVYFPESTYPLLNKNLVKSNKLSLGTAPEQRVMTFSTQFKEDGTVVSSKVGVSVVRNQIVTTYAKVDEILGTPSSTSNRLVLSSFPDQESLQEALSIPDLSRALQPLDDRARADLKQLHALSVAHLKQRARAGSIFWEYTSPTLRIHNTVNHPLPLDSELTRPVLYQGLPRASLVVPGFDAGLEPSDHESSTLRPSSVLVSEMMIAGNCAAAKHGLERALPLPYLGQRRPTSDESVLKKLYDCRDPDTGRLSVMAFLEATDAIQFPAAYTSSQAVAHWSLGISQNVGYIRATSPLRRHLDMVSHWMLKESLIDPNSRALRLTPELENFYAQPTGRIRRIGKRASQHWILWVLNQEYKRWQTEGGNKHPHLERLFTTLEGVLQRKPAFTMFSSDWVAPVFVPSLGITGIAYLPSSGMVKLDDVGTRIKLRIRDCQYPFLFMAFKLISHLDTPVAQSSFPTFQCCIWSTFRRA